MAEIKQRFFWKHRKSSALFVSIIIHVVLIMVAVTFVAVTVYVKPEQGFEIKEVKRPQMKLRKLQVPVKMQKKTQAPKLRKTIVAKPKTPTVDIKMPEIVGVKGGTGYGSGGGLGGLGFGFDLPDLFGSDRGAGNEFVGTFYDLKQTSKGGPSGLSEDQYREAIKSFVNSGFKESALKPFFKAPKRKYATAFMMPQMDANAAPKSFGVEEQVEPKNWICLYKGQIAAPETGQYRFCGFGDDVLAVRIKNRLVLDACWPFEIGKLSDWKSEDEDSRKFPIDLECDDYMRKHSRVVIGDWFNLRKGQVVDMEVLIGELPGGKFSCRLLIEQKNKEYEMAESDAGPRKVLPIFKTAPLDKEMVNIMKIDGQVSTVDGPVFGVQAK